MKKFIALVAFAAFTTPVQAEIIQIPDHPYKSVAGCERSEPIGKFDQKCDIPLLGFKNFSSDSYGITAGGNSGGWAGI